MFFDGLYYGQVDMRFAATGTTEEKEKEILLIQTKRYEKIPLPLHISIS